MSTAIETYKSTLRAVIREYRAELESWKSLDQEIADLKSRLREQDLIVSVLWRRLPEEEKAALEREFAPSFSANPARVAESSTELYREIQKILWTTHTETQSVKELTEQLRAASVRADPKSVSNILSRLANLGQLERVDRGVYRFARHRVLLGEVPEFLYDNNDEALSA